MWKCQKCNEEIEDTFDACWNCGTSVDGVENPDFHIETVESRNEPVGWNSFFAGAIVTTILAYFDYVIPYLFGSQGVSLTRRQLGMMLVEGAVWSIILGIAGGVAGWAGGRIDRLVESARKGAPILLYALLLCIFSGFVQVPFVGLPINTSIAVLVNFAALGAIAGTVGSIVGRRLRRKSAGEPFQYSISDMLFLTVLSGFLFASIAVLSG